jgi:beta-glucosidase
MEAVKNADCVVVCLGHDSVTEKENSDRTFDLPYGQVDYLRTVLKYNKNVVVVLNGGGGIEMASVILHLNIRISQSRVRARNLPLPSR